LNQKPVLVICMGVSGSGKSTLARKLSRRFKLAFFEADDYHGSINTAHMAAGLPLTDAMREPWINNLCQVLASEAERGIDCVLAYSGLRRNHRQRFRALGFRTLFLYLQGDKELIAARMHERNTHFMPVSLLDSQFEDMEPVADEPDIVIIKVDVEMEELEETGARAVKKFWLQEADGSLME